MPPLIAACHLCTGMAKLLLDIALIDLGTAGQTRTQRMAGIELHAFRIGQIRAQACCQRTGLDQPGDVLVIQSGLSRARLPSRVTPVKIGPKLMRP